jgi:hypothetical protein
MYVGRTKSFADRRWAHANDPEKGDLTFQEDWQTDKYAVQRGREQMLYDGYDPPLNKIRPVSPRNDNGPGYMQAALDASPDFEALDVGPEP